MDMDLDPEFEEELETDVVYQSKVLLVDARTLESVYTRLVFNSRRLTLCLDAKSQFSRIYSVHIYSLSPSRFGVRTLSTRTRSLTS
jgi:DNA polymerase delta subunit 3